MPRSVTFFLQYDAHTPHGDTPFSTLNSTWDMSGDFFLSMGLSSVFLEQFLGWSYAMRVEDMSGPITRGLPIESEHSQMMRYIKDEPIVGWVTGEEIDHSAREGVLASDMGHKKTQWLVKIVRLLGEEVGLDRVRLVFCPDV